MPTYTYLRTSSDDGKQKAGIPVQRRACAKFIEDRGFRLVQEFARLAYGLYVCAFAVRLQHVP